jgi:[ribosomal protein S18]-alanine N-acetyltransferase
MKICLVRADQSEILAAVHALAFERPWDASEIAASLQTPGAFALLADTGDPVGMIICRSAADEAEILTLAVSPQARRRGVAHALVVAAQNVARQSGAGVLLLEVGVANTAAVALYGRLGFMQAGRRKAYYDRGAGAREDALVLRLDLTSPAR